MSIRDRLKRNCKYLIANEKKGSIIQDRRLAQEECRVIRREVEVEPAYSEYNDGMFFGSQVQRASHRHCRFLRHHFPLANDDVAQAGEIHVAYVAG